MYQPNRIAMTRDQFPTERPSRFHEQQKISPPQSRGTRPPPPLVREKSEPVLLSKRNSILPSSSRSLSSPKSSRSTSRTTTMASQPSSDSLFKMAESTEAERPQSRARNLWAKGARLHRQSSKLSIASLAAMAQEEDQRPDSRMRLRMGRKRDSIYETAARHNRLKASISTPFDFQHLTHTQREQLPALKSSNEHELLVEFSSVRASQAPRRELNGIRCDDLQLRNFSMPAVEEDTSKPVEESGTPTLWPPQRREKAQRNRPPALRSSRSHESFSQPRHARQPSVPITPPPRASSRAAFTYSSNQTSPQTSPPGRGPKSAPLRSTPPSHLEETLPIPEVLEHPKTAPIDTGGFFEADVSIHAVTTPDETAVPALNSPERETSRVDASDKVQSPTCLSPRFWGESPTYHAITSPENTSSSRSSQNTSASFGVCRSPHKRSFSRQSDTLGPLGPLASPFTSSFNPRKSRGPSFIMSPSRNGPPSARGLFSSWEDDIDWCYEHEAEADFDFQWGSSPPQEHTEPMALPARRNSIELGRPSLSADDGQPRPSTSFDTRAEDDYLATRFFPGAFRPSLLIPVPPDVPEEPEFGPSTVASASTSRTSMSLRTPKDLEIAIPPPLPMTGDSLGSPSAIVEPEFNLTPSLLVPQDYKSAMAKEQMYEQMLNDYEPSDRHFLLLDGTRSNRSSNRSSHTHLSKNSSMYDTTSVDTTSSPVHRSDSTSSSLPDLVHSQRAATRKPSELHIESRPTSFIDIEEEPAGRQSVSSYYEDDSDTERASSAATARTFFASDNEAESSGMVNFDKPPVSPNPSLHHHERAASDGATKLLSMASDDRKASVSTLQRNRASSTGARRASRAGHFSLFPTAQKPRAVYS